MERVPHRLQAQWATPRRVFSKLHAKSKQPSSGTLAPSIGQMVQVVRVQATPATGACDVERCLCGRLWAVLAASTPPSAELSITLSPKWIEPSSGAGASLVAASAAFSVEPSCWLASMPVASLEACSCV